MKTATLPTVALLLFWAFSVAASDKATPEGKDLIEKAEATTNIFALKSFQMKAEVRVESKGKLIDGTYLILWNGPDQWREEIHLPGYSEVQVGGKGVVFLKRTTDFLPTRIDQLHSALGYGAGVPHPLSFFHLGPGPKETIKRVHEVKLNGAKAECVEIADDQSHKREVCADSSSGVVVRQHPFSDKEIIKIDNRLFPRFLSFIDDGRPVVEVNVTDLKTTELLPSSTFEPPAGSASAPGCMNPTPAHLVKRVTPQYPERERESHHQGPVDIDAVIGKDGIPRDLRVVSGITQVLNDASVDAIRQWRFDPATCNGTAVDVETVLRAYYSLR